MVSLINLSSETKMQNIINNFELELDSLLKLHLSKDELNQLDLKISPSKSENNKISKMINDFYVNQLEINVDSCNERIKIDRTITFSEKQLNSDKFCEFLLDLGRFCITSGKLNFASEIFKKTIKSSTKTLYEAEATLELANVLSRKADWPRSLITITDAEMLYNKINDSYGLAKCYNLLGSIYGDRGDIEKAKKYFLKSLALIDHEVNLEMAANLNANLGIIGSIQENADEAKKYLTISLVIYKKLNNQLRLAEVNYSLGTAYFESGDYEAALEAYDKGAEIAKNGHFISILCLLFLAKAKLLEAKDEIDAAAEFTDKALEISHLLDDKLTSADVFKVKGIIERRLKNYKLSESYLLNSLRINTSLRNEMNIAETSLELADLYEEINISRSKKSYLASALKYYKQINASQKIKEIENKLSIAIA
jgi:tetratricopeptide (TPR) repeat protein